MEEAEEGGGRFIDLQAGVTVDRGPPVTVELATASTGTPGGHLEQASLLTEHIQLVLTFGHGKYCIEIGLRGKLGSDGTMEARSASLTS